MMTNYRDCIDAIFRRDGILQDIYGTGYVYRKEQHEAALAICDFFENSSNPRKILQLLNMSTGAGKSLAVIINAAVFSKIFKKKVIIATSTRDLRLQYMKETTIVNDVLRVLNPEYGSVTISEFKSVMGIASPSIVEKYKDLYLSKVSDQDEKKHLSAFIEWYENSAKSDNFVNLSDWLSDDTVSNGVFPLGKRERDFCLCEEDVKILKEFKNLKRDIIEESDIILVTHAAYLRNGLNWGKNLKTRIQKMDEATNTYIEQTSPIGAIFVDEAHKLPDAAGLLSGNKFNLSEAERLMQKAEIETDLFDEIRGMIGSAENRYIFRPRNYTEFRNKLDNFYDMLIESISEQKDLILREQIRDFTYYIGPMVERNHKSGSTSSVARQYENSVMMIERDINGELSFGFVPGKVSHLIWVTYMLAGNQPTCMLSGTISISKFSKSDPWKFFKSEIGLNSRNANLCVMNSFNANSGKISEIILADRSAPIPTHGELEAKTHKTRVNDAYVSYFLSSFATIKNENPNKRVLVLLTSVEMLNKVYDGMICMGISSNDIVKQDAGQNYKSFLQKYQKNPNCVWLGMNWEGIDLRENGNTLVDIVVIPKIPFHGNFEFDAGMFNRALIKILQGIGRGLRGPEDVIKLCILDSRYPFLSEMESDDDSYPLFGAVDSPLYELFSDAIPDRMFSSDVKYAYIDVTNYQLNYVG